MFRRSSKKKPDPHGCCHYCQYFRESFADEARKDLMSVIVLYMRGKRGGDAGGRRNGYTVYEEVESSIEPAPRILLPAVMTSFAMALLYASVVVLAMGDVRGPIVETLLELAFRLAGSDFRSAATNVGAIIAGLAVALTALSWVRRKRPEDESGRQVMRAWLTDVLDDARREDAAAVLMIVLASSFGALVIAFWVSVYAAKYRGAQVYGDAFVGTVLTTAFGVIVLFLLLPRPSGNSAVRNCAVVLQNVVSWVRWNCSSSWSLGQEGVSKGKVARSGFVIFLTSALSFGLVWRLCLGGMTVALGAAPLYGLLCFFSVYLMATCVPAVVLRKPFARMEAVFRFVFMIFVPFLLFGLELIIGFGGRGWPVIIAELAWLILVYLLAFRGVRIPVLTDIVFAELYGYRSALERRWSSLMNRGSSRDRDDLYEVAKILVPAGSIIPKDEMVSDRRSMKAWSRRAVILVPEVGKPRNHEPGDIDLRAYIEDMLGIALPGGSAGMAQSHVKPEEGVVDDWHASSFR